MRNQTGNFYQNLMLSGILAVISLADPRGQEAFDLLKEKFKGQDQILNIIDSFEKQFKAAIGK